MTAKIKTCGACGGSENGGLWDAEITVPVQGVAGAFIRTNARGWCAECMAFALGRSHIKFVLARGCEFPAAANK